MFIDAHLHLDAKRDGDIAVAIDRLTRDMGEAGVDRAVVIHLDWQPWSPEVFAEATRHVPALCPLVNIDPRMPDAGARFRHCIEGLGFRGLKLHPRMHPVSLSDPRVNALAAIAGDLGVPVLVDCFPDGDWLIDGFDLASFAHLARHHPATRFVAAHLGGCRAIECMLIAKRIENLVCDVSFSPLYFADSGVEEDIYHCITRMTRGKILYGSDHPEFALSDFRARVVRRLSERLDAVQMTDFTCNNALRVYSWPTD